ncbi:MAG: ATP-binding protein [Aestuariivita sp.]|nr:ATP-binding protein [Aestuariivita sp.]MCY4201795.1 ATP-binding protein [Aestuariivita sp.]MCY4288475.1 ATP-binding protein [Aestuariivita sp.]MCY4347060.1 ATP-binding protein [Aestuariivita sp.]
MADITELTKFARSKERDAALFFQGREEFITDIKYAIQNAQENLRAGESTTSETRLFYGAPGAGKTSLLGEIAKRAEQGTFGAIRPIIVRVVSGKSLNSEEDVVLQIAEAIKKDAIFRTTSHSNATLKAAFPTIFGGSLTKGQIQNSPKATFLNLKQIIKDLSPSRTLLLCVDEIQNIGPDAKEMIDLLHQGNHTLPIIPVYAGLGNSLRVIMSHGISRPASGYIHTVSALAVEEAQAAVNAMLTQFKVARGKKTGDWPGVLAQRSDCWPQHLHNGMRALAMELIRPDINGELDRVDPNTVFAREQNLREQAYGWRLSQTFQQTQGLLSQIMHHITVQPHNLAELESLVLRLDQKAPRDPTLRAFSLPEDRDLEKYIHEMMHQGLLQEFSEQDEAGRITGTLRCPIPSLATYIMRLGGIDPSKAPPK